MRTLRHRSSLSSGVLKYQKPPFCNLTRSATVTKVRGSRIWKLTPPHASSSPVADVALSRKVSTIFALRFVYFDYSVNSSLPMKRR